MLTYWWTNMYMYTAGKPSLSITLPSLTKAKAAKLWRAKVTLLYIRYMLSLTTRSFWYQPAMALANDFSQAYIFTSLIQLNNSFIIRTWNGNHGWMEIRLQLFVLLTGWEEMWRNININVNQWQYIKVSLTFTLISANHKMLYLLTVNVMQVKFNAK